MTRKDRYHQYLRSGAWDVRRWDRLVADDFLCQVCGAEASDVHHRNYDHVYQERREDLISVCRRCHERITDLAKMHGNDGAIRASASEFAPQSVATIVPDSPPAPAFDGTFDSVRSHWREVLLAVKRYDQGVQALVNSGRPLKLDGDCLVLGFASNLLRERIEKRENLALVQRSLQDVFGRPMRVTCVLLKDCPAILTAAYQG